ncbi:MAG: type II toxin-antitoxin system VapC family toxin [Pirellulales bacterium]|nr:type II toxin-antitoxin system VapC family toxin [Pirellulales bacterium]
MSRYVLDASAVLALLQNESGADELLHYSFGASLSTVNLAEVYSKTADVGLSLEDLQWAIGRLQLNVIPFDEGHAAIVGSLREPTRKAGLSLGDRACLAAGVALQCPVVTADSAWEALAIDVEVIQFRMAA